MCFCLVSVILPDRVLRSDTWEYIPLYTNVVLKSAFQRPNGSQQQLNVIHINSGSIVKKMDEIRRIVEDTDILAVSETWLKSYHPAKNFKLVNFNLYRNDGFVGAVECAYSNVYV